MNWGIFAAFLVLGLASRPAAAGDGHVPAIAVATNGHPPAEPAAVDCGGYRPGQSGSKPEAYWRLAQGKGGYEESQKTAPERAFQMNRQFDPELTPALLDLFTSPETMIYFAGYSPPRSYPKDGRRGLNMILLQRKTTTSGAKLPVAAIVSVEWDPRTFGLRLQEGPDAIRIHSALRARDQDSDERTDVGLSYEVAAGPQPPSVRIAPGEYFHGGKRKDDVPHEAIAASGCLSCHAGENGMTHHRSVPEVPLKTEADYESYLPTEWGVKNFMEGMKQAVSQSGTDEGAGRRLLDDAYGKLRRPRDLLPAEWVEALKSHCEDLRGTK